MMRVVLSLAAVSLLAACSADEAGAALDPATATSAGDYLGTYHLAYADGTEADVTFEAGGKVAADFGGQAVTATYTVPQAGKVCFENVSAGDPPHCWANGPAEDDGAWTATLDDGSTLVVTPKK